jgi:hypothetical protein
MSTTSRPPATAAAVFAAMRACSHHTPAGRAQKGADASFRTAHPSCCTDCRRAESAEVSCDRGQSQPTISDAEPGEPPASSGSGWGRTGPSTRSSSAGFAPTDDANLRMRGGREVILAAIPLRNNEALHPPRRAAATQAPLQAGPPGASRQARNVGGFTHAHCVRPPSALPRAVQLSTRAEACISVLIEGPIGPCSRNAFSLRGRDRWDSDGRDDSSK